jgi:hypothetical protein
LLTIAAGNRAGGSARLLKRSTIAAQSAGRSSGERLACRFHQ